METFIDPAVSRIKFEREIEEYRKLEQEHQRRGWWLMKANFPRVIVAFATVNTNPAALIFAALLDFTDYDFQPPSVKLVHPFTLVPYKYSELPTRLRRISPAKNGEGFEVLALMVAHNENEIPFLCLPGVREYHNHPAHTGDLWELHRGKGEGKLFFILDQLHKYGAQHINGFTFKVEFRAEKAGFTQAGIPQ